MQSISDIDIPMVRKAIPVCGESRRIALTSFAFFCIHTLSLIMKTIVIMNHSHSDGSGAAYGGAPRFSCHLREKLPGLPFMLNFASFASSSIAARSFCMISHDWSGRFGDL